MILIVDDSTDILDVLSLSLQVRGIKHEICSTGKEAIKRVTANKYKLIILDIHLVNENGCDICTKIRKIRPKQKIIACSGLINEKLLKCFDDWIEKPFTINEFIQKVKNYI